MAEKKKTEKPKEEKKEKEEKFSDKIKSLLAVPLSPFMGILDDIFIATLLPAMVRYVDSRNDWKREVYQAGYKLGVETNDQLDNLIKGRGELVEDPIQEFVKEFTSGWQDGCNVDEGVEPKYPFVPVEEDED